MSEEQDYNRYVWVHAEIRRKQQILAYAEFASERAQALTAEIKDLMAERDRLLDSLDEYEKRRTARKGL